ncbi:juvenile hormone acid O-methyltransferase [Diachasma alloeum]|uniref:juvenile hormone acid O-methyltransferase n=1 Tax=Diachasma alloeum TaxID=454923 RepID=UPI0007382852|nr:juvenile hormone acid O-methyltransferase [Diachasma alloeum]XP_015118101.1 juvenile hormone acid O-methyltransferase [Diachasma alloeum]
MNQPKEYAESNRLQYRDIEELVEEFPEVFKEMKGRIIDVGCGPGNITKGVLLPAVGEDAIIIGADLCRFMVAYAEQHYAVENKLSYLQLDIQTPELPKNLIGQFDNATSFYCLHWCRNTKLALENFYKLLRPGGKAIILTISHHMIFDVYSEQREDPIFSAYMQDSLEFTSPQHGRPDAEEIVRKDLNEVGFKIHYCANRWKTFTYPTLDAFLDLVMSVNPFVKRLPADLQKPYREDFEERLKSKYLPKKDYSNGSSVDCRISLLIAVFEKPDH